MIFNSVTSTVFICSPTERVPFYKHFALSQILFRETASSYVNKKQFTTNNLSQKFYPKVFTYVASHSKAFTDFKTLHPARKLVLEMCSP